MADEQSPRAEPPPVGRPPRMFEVLLVAAALVGIVGALVALTFLLPDDIERFVYDTPLAIAVLIAGTAAVLWRISRQQRS